MPSAGRRVREKPYVVGVPVPSLNRNGEQLNRDDINRWVALAEAELTACFGGATSLEAPGTNIVDGKVLYEAGQLIVMSACDSRADFVANRERLAAFVEKMGAALDQAAVSCLRSPPTRFSSSLKEIHRAPVGGTRRSVRVFEDF